MENIENDILSHIPKSDYREELLNLITGDTSSKDLKFKLSDYHESDIADIFHELSQEERRKLYDALDTEILSDIFSYLDDVEIYVSELNNARAADIIEEMDADDAVEVLQQLPEEQMEDILTLLDEEAKQDVSLITSFDEDTIGSRMTTNFIVVNKNNTIKEVMRSLVKQAADNDNVQKIFVIDDEECFYGAIDLRDLIIARDRQPLEDVIATKYPFFYADTLIEECVEELKNYSEDAIPILSTERKLLGVITASDVIDVVHEEIADDYAKFAGLTEAEDLKEPLLKSIRKRLPWLLILLLLGLFISAIIQAFQNNIPSNLIVIYTFQSLVLNMSGNTGTQSLSVTIRVLSDEKLNGLQKLLFVLKELRVGFFNGLIIGLIGFVSIGAYIQFFATALTSDLGVSGFAVSACIGISLLVAMTIASLSGTLVPLLFKKLKIDPAVASGPLITTLNDLVAVCTYYGLSIFLFVVLLQK